MKDFSEKRNNDVFIHITIAFNEDSYKIDDVLVVLSLETGEGYVLDLGCSYHICLRKQYFEILKLDQAGVILLSDNKD